MANDSQSAGGNPAIPPSQGVLDANGFVATDFEWRPVPRRPRKDGWTPEVQQEFIKALMRTGSVELACREVDRSVRSAYDLRYAPGGEGFARAWAAVLSRAADRVLDIAFEQATVGEEVPIYDQDGVRTGVRWKYNTRMAMLLLKAYHPERFRHAEHPVRHPDEPQPPALPSAADVVASLAPVTPVEPHLLAPPGQLLHMIDRAEHEAARDGEPAPDTYRAPRVPHDHPRVRARASRNQARRRRREDREDKLFGPPPCYDHPDDS